MFADCVVIHYSLRAAVLRQLYSSHQDISHMKNMVPGTVYWPNLDSKIENKVKSCIYCMETQKNSPHSDDSHWSESTFPWS